ncbi:hypothetical protein M8818_000479 [Zalaria obscura]|uniref:Uncharacterized protein n=1 Tax=Zalaria obscura TaxID=2024903 RepID=A0ACC3SNW1_9PEZI
MAEERLRRCFFSTWVETDSSSSVIEKAGASRRESGARVTRDDTPVVDPLHPWKLATYSCLQFEIWTYLRSDIGWGNSVYPPAFYSSSDHNISYTTHPYAFWDILNDPSPEQAQNTWAPSPESAPPPQARLPLRHFGSNIAEPSTPLPSINEFYDDREVMPAGSSSETWKRTRSSASDSASPELKRLRRTSTNQRKIEELDLAEPGSAEKLREKQTEDLVKAQQEDEGEKHKGFKELTCMICMDTFTNMTATHCGR